MALPGSGTISMDMIRIELGVPSQSPFGLNEARSGTYAAINPNSTYKPPSSGTVSLSDWYGYNHTLNIPLNVTGTLYTHMAPVSGDGQGSIYNTSMLIVDVGTTSATMSINISGSGDYAEENVWVFYGKPWTNTGTGSPNVTYIGGDNLSGYYPFNYNYTYDSAKGQYLYFIISYANN